MRKKLLLACFMFCVGFMFSSCEKTEDWAAEIAGTYKGTNFSKTETSAIIVLERVDNTHVLLSFDAATKELASDFDPVEVTKEGNVYKLESESATQKIQGTVENNILKLVVTFQNIEILNAVAEKEV